MSIHEGPDQFDDLYTLDSNTYPPYCNRVTDVLSLKGQKTGIIRFQGGLEGWPVDNNIKVHYVIKVVREPHWSDKDDVGEIEIESITLEGIYNGETLGLNDEHDTLAEIYLEERGINIQDQIKIAYYGE